ncbi:MAG: HD domain-containing phosphohydrolase [Coriobacteriales bacterium]
MFLLVVGFLLAAETALCWLFAFKAFRHTGRFALCTGSLCFFAGLVCLTGIAPLFIRDAFVLRLVAVFFFGGVTLLMSAGIAYAMRLNNLSDKACRRVQLLLLAGNVADLALLALNVATPLVVDYSPSFSPDWGYTMTPDFGLPMVFQFAWCYAQAVAFTLLVVRRAAKAQAIYRAPLVRLLILIALSVMCNILYSVRGDLGPLDFCIFFYGFTVLEAYTNVFHYMRGMEYAQVTDVVAQGAPYPVLSFAPGGELLFANPAASELFCFDEAKLELPTLQSMAREYDMPQLLTESGLVEYQWHTTGPERGSYSCEFSQVLDKRGELVGYALTMKDTSELIDIHTGLYNEDAFRAYRRKLQDSGVKPVTVAAISLNHLNAMNEQFGRVRADEAVWGFAAKLKEASASCTECFVAYRGGANFGVLSTSIAREDLEECIASLRAGIEWNVPSTVVADFEYAVVEYNCDGTLENLTMACRKADELVKLKRMLSPTSSLSAQVNSLVRPLVDRGLITLERVEVRAQLAQALAREMGEGDETAYLSALAAKLCDIGKLSLPDSVAFYRGELPRGARRLKEQHVEVGYRILRAMGSTAGLPEAVLHHHERWDGAGYPDGLAGNDIPLIARIVSVACTFDSMVNRPSGALPSLTPRQAVEEVLSESGARFDPCVAEALARVLEGEDHDAADQLGGLFTVEDQGSHSLASRVAFENVGGPLGKPRALVVDDLEMNRFIIGEALKDEFDVLEASNGKDALALLEKDEDEFEVVLLDLAMPTMDGYGFLEALRSSAVTDPPPILVITADDDIETCTKCLDLGAAEFLPKPISPGILRRRVSNAVELYSTRKSLQRKVHDQAADIVQKNNELKAQSAQLTRINEQLGSILSNIMEYRDCDTAGHVDRVQGFATVLAQELVDNYPAFGFTQADVVPLGRAAALHDIGKIAIPDHILFKPSMLTPDEMAVMKTHSMCGYQLISNSLAGREDSFSRFALEVVLSHHERWDGSGYPEGLSGSAIPVSAQITALADVYDALTSDRPYKRAISSDVAIDMIVAGECGAFSSVMLDIFKKVAPRFESMYTKELRPSASDPVEEYRRILRRGFEQGIEVGNNSSLENIVHLLLDVNAKLTAKMRRDRGTSVLSKDAYLDYLETFDSNLVTCVGTAYFDVNGLHEYNREHGHSQGDAMLAEVARSIMEVFGEERAYRTGGDEFVAICEDMPEQELARMVEQVEELFEQRGLSCAVGYEWRDSDLDMDAMIRSADMSMFQNKARFYEENDRRNVRGGGLISALR